MPPLQTVFNQTMAPYALGRRVNMEEWNTITRINSEAIGFAQPAYQGAGDDLITAGGTFGATAVGAADAGNTGAGAITASPAVAAGAKQGAYKVIQITGGATGAFNVFDPDGLFVGNGAVGTEFVGGGLTFTVTDPGTDPAIGDSYTVTVTFTENAVFVGITETDYTLPYVAATPNTFPTGSNVPVCEVGVIAVMAGGTCTRKTPVYWISASGTYTSTATGNIRIPNAEFDDTVTTGNLVPVRLRRQPVA